MKHSALFKVLAVSCALLMLLSSCTTPATTPTAGTTPSTQTSIPETGTTDPAPSTIPQSTPTSTPTPEEPYEFPANGVMKLIADGEAPGAIDGHNPSLAGDKYTKLLVVFDCAGRNAGIDMADDTDITYSVKRQNGTVLSGTAKLDNSVSEIKTEYGYVGVCIELGTEFDKNEKITITSISFKDKAGKEYSVSNKTFYKGISYRGVNAYKFDEHLGSFVTTTIANTMVKQTGVVNGREYSFKISLNYWEGNTKVDQIVTIAQLFWQVYPRMYERFGVIGNSPTNITLDIKNHDYGIAYASGDYVHLHDQWLQGGSKDYDCLTHEFAHVIQNGWSGEHCEYSDYIERFADACRYLYAFDSGKYNDTGWELNTISGESTREKSVRFLIWLDYFYSTDEIDVLARYYEVCYSRRYTANKWDAAWAEILRGTQLEGKNIDTIFEMFANSEFAKLSSQKVGSTSMLLRKFPDVRTRLK